MAFSGKSEQRAAASTNYGGASATLNSSSIKEPASMDNGPKKAIFGSLTSKSNSATLYGRQNSGSPSGIVGRLSGSGYPSGPKWQRAMEPGELKPGKASQAKNTTRMTPGKGDKEPVMKVTGTTPKALRGGR